MREITKNLNVGCCRFTKNIYSHFCIRNKEFDKIFVVFSFCRISIFLNTRQKYKIIYCQIIFIAQSEIPSNISE